MTTREVTRPKTGTETVKVTTCDVCGREFDWEKTDFSSWVRAFRGPCVKESLADFCGACWPRVARQMKEAP